MLIIVLGFFSNRQLLNSHILDQFLKWSCRLKLVLVGCFNIQVVLQYFPRLFDPEWLGLGLMALRMAFWVALVTLCVGTLVPQ